MSILHKYTCTCTLKLFSQFADFVFSTTHKAKGLEFDTVVVCEDFIARYFSSLKCKLHVQVFFKQNNYCNSICEIVFYDKTCVFQAINKIYVTQ